MHHEQTQDTPRDLSLLPDRDSAQIIGSLDATSRAALRATCKANKAVVDAHVNEARYYGVCRHPRQQSTLPPFIKGAHICALGPPTMEWLCRSLAHLQHLSVLHLTCERAKEEDLLKSKRSPPDQIGPVQMLHHLATTNLKELHINGFGMNVRYTREKQWRALLPPKEKVDALARTVQSLQLTEEFRMYRNIFQRLIVPLTQLRSLDLGGTHWGYLAPYATHELSQMTALTALRLNMCQALLSSHVAPLYTITALKLLDLSDVQFSESAHDFEAVDPLAAHPNRLEALDKDTQQFVLQLRHITGWGPQVPMGLGSTAPPLHREQGIVPHPALFVLSQLGRCTGLEDLAFAGWELPEMDEDVDEHNFAVGQHTLAHLTNLTKLDLDTLTMEALPFIARLPHLRKLSCDSCGAGEEDAVDLNDMLDALNQASRLPQLQSLCLPESYLGRGSGLSTLRQLSAVTHLDLGYMDTEDDWADLREVHLSSICAADMFREADAPRLQRLAICGWLLPLASALSPLTALTELDVSETFGDTSRPLLAELDWPPDLFAQLVCLKRLTCTYTNFGDDQLVRALTCSPSLQVLQADKCCVSELGVLRASHPGAAALVLHKFHRRLRFLTQHHADMIQEYLQQHGLPDTLLSRGLQPAFGLSGDLASLQPVHVQAPLIELDLSSQVLDAAAPAAEPRKAGFGDAAALALAACLPGLRDLSLRECARLGGAGWLALASLTALTHLDVRRCNLAGHALSMLAQNQAPPEWQQAADRCIQDLGGCSSMYGLDDLIGLPETAAEEGQRSSSRWSIVDAVEGGEAGATRGGGGAEAAGSSGAKKMSGHEALGGVTLKAWQDRLRACVGIQRRMFPSLAKLMITDDRTELAKVLHISHVDALADAVAWGTCDLRELHVDKGEELSRGEGSSEEDSGDESGSSEWSTEEGPAQQQQDTHLAHLPWWHGANAGSSIESGSGGSSDSEWEEMEWGKDKEADAAAEAKLEVRKLPPLLQVANCQRWLDAGLLVVRAPNMHEVDDR